MIYIEERIGILEQDFDTVWAKIYDLEHAVYKKSDGKQPQVQQTTEEFVKVVRCKDCKWYIKDTTDPYIFDCCNEDGLFHPSDDDYCSEGEKK